MKRIAISSPRFSFENYSEAISKDFPGWEILADGRYSVLRLEKEELPRAIYLAIHGPVGYVNIGALEDPFRKLSEEYLIALMEIMNKRGIEDLVIHPGSIPPGYCNVYEKVFRKTLESLKRLSFSAKEFGINLYLENMPKREFFTFYSPKELLMAVKEAEVEICFDIGHAFIGGELKNFLEEEELKRYITRAHVHDNDGKRDLHLPPGKGKINFEVLKNFREIKTYVLEINTIEDAYEAYNWAKDHII